MPSPFDNVAARLKEAIPKRPDGKEITAWREQAVALNKMRSELTNALNRIALLEGQEPPPEPPPPPPPEPTPARLAPQTYNLGSNNADPRYCTSGLPRNQAGEFYEPSNPGIRYDTDGRELSGGRNRNKIVAGLKRANEMDGRGPCDPYTHEGRAFPPWPEESYS